MRRKDWWIACTLWGLGLLCFALAIFGPLIWPMNSHETVSVYYPVGECEGD